MELVEVEEEFYVEGFELLQHAAKKGIYDFGGRILDLLVVAVGYAKGHRGNAESHRVCFCALRSTVRISAPPLWHSAQQPKIVNLKS